MPGRRSRPASSASTRSRSGEGARADVECSPPRDANPDLPETFVDYVETPREYFLKAVTTVLDVQTRVSDLYSQPFDQVQEQLRLLIEKVKERQESELINNGEYGLLASAAPSQRIKTRKGPPTPDDLDELLTKVWKEPSFFLAHPRAIAAFGRECTRRGVPPPTVTLFGNAVPHLARRAAGAVGQGPHRRARTGRSAARSCSIRTGEKKQGVVGLFQPGVPGEVAPSLSVRFMGISSQGDRVLSDLALLLARRADRGRARGARGRRSRPLSRIYAMATPD